MGNSKIEWTEATWNPIVGCSIVSPGCTNCYAMKMAARIEAMKRSHYDGTTKKVNGKAVWTGKIALAPEYILLAPLKRKKPTTYFVNSMGDLFHEDCPDEWIDKVFAVMALCPQHTFQVLTKRAARMLAYCAEKPINLSTEVLTLMYVDGFGRDHPAVPAKWPFPNVWLGVSTERQQEADERIPLLLQTPAAVRFISAEPLLGPINLKRIKVAGLGWQDVLEGWRDCKDYPGRENALDWVIVGGESGPAARPMHPDWPRSLRDQCRAAGVAFFFKQWGNWKPISFADLASEEFENEELAGHIQGFADQPMHNVGKKNAGRILDGREWNDYPTPAREPSGSEPRSQITIPETTAA